MHSFFFCFPACHCFLSYSEVLLTAAAFVQVLSHIDFPSPKLYIKECGIKENFFFLLQIKENVFVFRTPKDQLNLLSKQKKVCIRISFHNVWIKKIFWRDHLFEIQVSRANKNPLPVHLGMENLLALLNSLESK